MSSFTLETAQRRVTTATSAVSRRLLMPAIAIGTAVFLALVEVEHPTKLRLVAAFLFAGLLVTFALTTPRHGLLAVFTFLPLLALLRRLLLMLAPWTSSDPLILVGPTVLFVLLLQRQTLIHRRTTDRVSRIVGLLVIWTALEILNPRDGGIRGGLAGFLVTGLPLLWFFVGRDLVDRKLAASLLAITIPIGGIIAVYGLLQSTGRFTSFDRDWATTNGYTALVVNNVIRAFGTFSSSAEYVTYLAVGIVVACAFAMYRHILGLVIVPLLAVAILLDGTRGIIVLLALTLTLLVGLRTRRAVLGLVVALALAGGIAATIHSYSGTLQTKAAASGNVLVQHQVNGITSPLNRKRSTLPTHWTLFVSGIKEGFRQPLGAGPAATNRAGSAYGVSVAPSEIDVSNAFVDGGIIGGVLYALIVVMVFRRAWWVFQTTADGVVLAAIAVLLVTLGNWTNGGYYAITGLVWLLIGWIEGQWMRQREAQHIPRVA